MTLALVNEFTTVAHLLSNRHFVETLDYHKLALVRGREFLDTIQSMAREYNANLIETLANLSDDKAERFIRYGNLVLETLDYKQGIINLQTMYPDYAFRNRMN
jgi:hypothetical protein